MIISRKNKYIFVESPRTGCSAISAELCQNYDGEHILYKHATYNEFLKVATNEEKEYFAFVGMRNPLDISVSQYFKYKSNHKNNYSSPERLLKNGGFVTEEDVKKYLFIKQNDADFATYFEKFYDYSIYNNYYLMPRIFDFVIQFESIQESFNAALNAIGLQPVRPLPTVNKTALKDDDFWSYYTPEIFERAIYKFGPFMKEWGYTFPDEWGDAHIPVSSRMKFEMNNIIANFLVCHLPSSFYSNDSLLRKAREKLRKVWG